MRRRWMATALAVALTGVVTGLPAAAHTDRSPSVAGVPASTSLTSWLRRGSTGEQVRQVQTRLRELGYTIAVDGDFGSQTRSIVRQFQRDRGLHVDGVVGPRTWAALGLDNSSPSSEPSPAPSGGTLTSSLRRGSTGEQVRQVQARLRELGYAIAVDGDFGSQTRTIVRQFQISRALYVDGVVGRRTWAALGLDGSSPAPEVTPTPSAGSYRHPNALVERWHDDALAAGWPDSDWKRLSCIIYRESGGIPTAKNPRSSAMGLLQIMWSVHASWIGGSSSQLYDGPTNLRWGRKIYERAGGWKPWVSTSSKC